MACNNMCVLQYMRCMRNVAITSTYTNVMLREKSYILPKGANHHTFSLKSEPQPYLYQVCVVREGGVERRPQRLCRVP